MNIQPLGKKSLQNMQARLFYILFGKFQRPVDKNVKCMCISSLVQDNNVGLRNPLITRIIHRTILWVPYVITYSYNGPLFSHDSMDNYLEIDIWLKKKRTSRQKRGQEFAFTQKGLFFFIATK